MHRNDTLFSEDGQDKISETAGQLLDHLSSKGWKRPEIIKLSWGLLGPSGPGEQKGSRLLCSQERSEGKEVGEWAGGKCGIDRIGQTGVTRLRAGWVPCRLSLVTLDKLWLPQKSLSWPANGNIPHRHIQVLLEVDKLVLRTQTMQNEE